MTVAGPGTRRWKEHCLHLLAENPTANVGTGLAASMVFAAKHGHFTDQDRSTSEYRSIERDLRARYGEFLTPDEVRRELEV